MAGYYNFSMSNNAVEAYASGEKPLSKWTKSDVLQAILEAVYNEEVTLHFNLEKLKKVPLMGAEKKTTANGFRFIKKIK